jgi:F-type H+-transporting ATPase subunit gamma
VASILDLRRRIRSVRNTQKITRAMKMVAAARLRRAQDRVVNARPYAQHMQSFLRNLGRHAEPGSHPLLAHRPVKKKLLALVTADRGLCGAFNANLIRAAQRYFQANPGVEISILAVGRKGRDFFRKKRKLAGEYPNLFQRPVEFSLAQPVARQIEKLFSDESVDAVDVTYQQFKSLMSSNLVTEHLLPIEEPSGPDEEAPTDYIWEQPPEEILGHVLPRYLEAEVFQDLLESQAAELASRMTAMDTATNNAGELLETLTLHLNRVRQAAITKEIIEIVSGAAAL